MGMLAIAPSDTQQVWAGTGEPNSRNTIEPGQRHLQVDRRRPDWKLMGLEKTQHIGRIAVDPRNPNSSTSRRSARRGSRSRERGLYKTDGRRRDVEADQVRERQGGLIDVGLDPSNPNVV